MSQISSISPFGGSPAGDVVGPASSTNNAFVLWDGTTGKLIKDGPTIIPLSQGGSNAALTADAGGIVYSTASAFAVLAHTATSNQLLMSGGTSAPGWSTATYPVSTTINQILYSSAANTIVGLATANSGVLITSAGGVPSISSTLPSAVQGNITSLGTIASGVWNGTVIDASHGGTGTNTLTDHGLLVGSGTSPVDALAVGSTGAILLGVTGADPAWSVGGVMTVGAAGEITLPLQPAFRATLSADASNITGNNAAYTVAFNTEAFDQNADYDNTTYTFTAPVAGIYMFVVDLFSYGHSTGTSYDLQLQTSASSGIQTLQRFSPLSINSGTNLCTSSVAIVSLTASSTVKVVFTVNGQGAKTVSIQSGATNSSFSGFKLA